MPGPFKTRKQLEKEYSFKKPRVFSNLGKNKLADAIRVITGKAPFKKKAKGGVVKMNSGGEITENLQKAIKGLKPTDMSKIKTIDPKVQKIFERVMGKSPRAKKMNMGGVVPGRGGSFKGTR